jgi:hypothetical protein
MDVIRDERWFGGPVHRKQPAAIMCRHQRLAGVCILCEFLRKEHWPLISSSDLFCSMSRHRLLNRVWLKSPGQLLVSDAI